MKKRAILSFVVVIFFLLFTYLVEENSTVKALESTSDQPKEQIIKSYAEIIYRDLRIDTVNYFFKKYGPKMKGLGAEIVLSADKYNIPFGLLPAIGACEGGLGNKIPANSFNTWGWGIYGGKIKFFDSWEDAIDKVSAGISQEYFQKGLDTPEKMMSKYAPRSSGTWAICVNKYLADFD